MAPQNIILLNSFNQQNDEIAQFCKEHISPNTQFAQKLNPISFDCGHTIAEVILA
jgi:hypothetical protein